jgi:aconitate decarboxylase
VELVGAAVGLGNLLGLETSQMQKAISDAVMQVVGMQKYFELATIKFHIGRAAQGGILGALLAQDGCTSSLQAL